MELLQFATWLLYTFLKIRITEFARTTSNANNSSGINIWVLAVFTFGRQRQPIEPINKLCTQFIDLLRSVSQANANRPSLNLFKYICHIIRTIWFLPVRFWNYYQMELVYGKVGGGSQWYSIDYNVVLHQKEYCY